MTRNEMPGSGCDLQTSSPRNLHESIDASIDESVGISFAALRLQWTRRDVAICFRSHCGPEAELVDLQGRELSTLCWSMTLHAAKPTNHHRLGVAREGCREFCQKRGWTVREIFRGAGVSGWAGVERPAFRRMIESIRKNGT